jgi:zinc protease
MKRILSIVLLGLGLSAPALAQEPATAKPTEALPTVDKILDNYLKAVGGRDAWEKLTSRVSKGSMQIPAMNLNCAVEIDEKAPDKNYTVTTIPGFGDVRQGFDGAVGWTSDPQSGLHVMAGQELAEVKRDSQFYMPLRLRQIYPHITLKGKDKLGDHDAWIIEVAPAEGAPDTLYFDAQTGLLLRQKGERETPQGKAQIQTDFEDYRDVDGIKLPFTIRQTSDMSSFIIQVTEVHHNVPVDDAKFAKPAPAAE